MIETNRFFLQKEGVNGIVLRYKIGTQSDRKSQKRGSSPRNLPTMPKYGSFSLSFQMTSATEIRETCIAAFDVVKGNVRFTMF